MDAKEIVAKLHELASEFEVRLGSLATEQSIRDLQAAYLGKKGSVAELQKTLGNVEPALRKEIGLAFNSAKQRIS
jgi:hypothetical protein